MLKNKKGMTLGDIYPAVLTIILIGIVLGIGIFVLAEIRTEIATEYTGSDTLEAINGTTSDWTNDTTLSDSTKDDYKLLTVVAINGTGAGTFTNYTWVATTGVITWGNDIAAQASGGGDATANISSTYIYDVTDSPEEAINDTLEGIGGFGGWIAIIIVIIAAAIVLGIVLSSFRRRPEV